MVKLTDLIYYHTRTVRWTISYFRGQPGDLLQRREHDGERADAEPHGEPRRAGHQLPRGQRQRTRLDHQGGDHTQHSM